MTSRIDVYRLGPGFTGALERDDVTREVEAAIRLAEEADLLVAATPVFRGSYPGMFKHFFDLVDQCSGLRPGSRCRTSSRAPRRGRCRCPLP
ncbi:NADPH-dependent FMN reductase [Nonomuraea cypriaca]|uniref:NADPH-dependent FMN reductase n=1 Tax=Nonomuraea cypriaca TaxID=1187855 RepID=UPI001A9C8454